MTVTSIIAERSTKVRPVQPHRKHRPTAVKRLNGERTTEVRLLQRSRKHSPIVVTCLIGERSTEVRPLQLDMKEFPMAVTLLIGERSMEVRPVPPHRKRLSTVVTWRSEERSMEVRCLQSFSKEPPIVVECLHWAARRMQWIRCWLVELGLIDVTTQASSGRGQMMRRGTRWATREFRATNAEGGKCSVTSEAPREFRMSGCNVSILLWPHATSRFAGSSCLGARGLHGNRRCLRRRSSSCGTPKRTRGSTEGHPRTQHTARQRRRKYRPTDWRPSNAFRFVPHTLKMEKKGGKSLFSS